MNREQYLADPDVRSFIEWCTPLLQVGGVFRHGYDIPVRGSREGGRPARRPWACDSLFDAYIRYEWRGEDFEATERSLASIRGPMREAHLRGDADALIRAAEQVLHWGGVLARNREPLRILGERAPHAFSAAMAQLDPARADTRQMDAVWRMNSGFTKIYALLLDGFPMYDGRVGAALGYLVRCHLGADATAIPETIRFPWGAGQGSLRGDARKNRNPSSPALRFPALRATRQHAIANVRAAWLIGALGQSGEFGTIEPARRLLALQSALFMIGYEIPRG